MPGHQDALCLLDRRSPAEGALEALVLAEALQRDVDRALQLLGRPFDDVREHAALSGLMDVRGSLAWSRAITGHDASRTISLISSSA